MVDQLLDEILFDNDPPTLLGDRKKRHNQRNIAP